MTPRLPPELISEILSWAQAGQTDSQQQQIRNEFRLVCHEWNTSFVYWNEIRVDGSDQLNGLANALTKNSSSTLFGHPTKADQLRTVIINLGDDELEAGDRASLATVLGLASSIERFELTVVGPLGARVSKALSKQTSIKHFKLSVNAYFTVDNLHALVSDWTDLRSVSVIDTELGASDSQLDRILGSHRYLDSVTLGDIPGSIVYESLVGGLPRTIRHLALVGPGLFVDAPPAVISTLEGLAPNLETLTLSDMLEGFGGPRRPTQRGVYDSVVCRLRKVKQLSISPVGVSNLATSLGSLPHLAELTIGLGTTGCPTFLEAAEVIALVERAPALAKLTIRRKLWVVWSQSDKQDLDAAALAKGVSVVLMQAPRAGARIPRAAPTFLGVQFGLAAAAAAGPNPAAVATPVVPSVQAGLPLAQPAVAARAGAYAGAYAGGPLSVMMHWPHVLPIPTPSGLGAVAGAGGPHAAAASAPAAVATNTHTSTHQQQTPGST